MYDLTIIKRNKMKKAIELSFSNIYLHLTNILNNLHENSFHNLYKKQSKQLFMHYCGVACLKTNTPRKVFNRFCPIQMPISKPFSTISVDMAFSMLHLTLVRTKNCETFCTLRNRVFLGRRLKGKKT